MITPTEKLHFRAWKDTFDKFFSSSHLPDKGKYMFTGKEYSSYIDGKPRTKAIESFLQSLNIVLDTGTENDKPGFSTIYSIGNMKNLTFNKIIDTEGIEPYKETLEFMDFFVGKTRMSVVSSSKNAMTVLQKAGITDKFCVIIDGIKSTELHLKGKPDPATYLYGAAQTGCIPSETVIFEDALSGVKAGKEGKFGLVVGIDRGAGKNNLLSSGADIVVNNLTELLL